VRSAWERRLCRSFMPALPKHCPVFWEGHCGGWASRVIGSRRCAAQVRICSRCDHGNIYCAGECARIRRRESRRRASARYQRTRRGAHRHAARQRRWRIRQRQEVTHQGCDGDGGYGNVSEPTTPNPELTRAHPSLALCRLRTFSEVGVCSLCGAPLPPWTRPRRWHWSG
jgi:hypothetical protein